MPSLSHLSVSVWRAGVVGGGMWARWAGSGNSIANDLDSADAGRSVEPAVRLVPDGDDGVAILLKCDLNPEFWEV